MTFSFYLNLDLFLQEALQATDASGPSLQLLQYLEEVAQSNPQSSGKSSKPAESPKQTKSRSPR